MEMNWSGARAAGVAAACLLVSACSSTSSDGGSSAFRNLLLYGGFTVPPAAPGDLAEVNCPAVAVIPGGAALSFYAGGRTGSPEALRNQLSIADVARQCIRRPDGSVVVKVGVEGRALVGPAGSAGRFEAPVRFVIKRGEQVLASATRRATVALTPSETQGTFLVVEEGLVVPAGTGDFDIEVGLGGSAAAERPARRARR
jgi:hypothetical protein